MDDGLFKLPIKFQFELHQSKTEKAKMEEMVGIVLLILIRSERKDSFLEARYFVVCGEPSKGHGPSEIL